MESACRSSPCGTRAEVVSRRSARIRFDAEGRNSHAMTSIRPPRPRRRRTHGAALEEMAAELTDAELKERIPPSRSSSQTEAPSTTGISRSATPRALAIYELRSICRRHGVDDDSRSRNELPGAPPRSGRPRPGRVGEISRLHPALPPRLGSGSPMPLHRFAGTGRCRNKLPTGPLQQQHGVETPLRAIRGGSQPKSP